MNGQRHIRSFSCIKFKTDVTQTNNVQKKLQEWVDMKV